MSAPVSAPEDRRDRRAIETWLVDYVTRLLGTKSGRVDRNSTFDKLGLDSAATVGLTGELSEWLQIEVDASVAYDHPTIAELSQHLAEEVAKQ